jgi:hypothetical protein
LIEKGLRLRESSPEKAGGNSQEFQRIGTRNMIDAS